MPNFYLECYTGLKWFKENIQYQFESTKVFLSKFLSQDFCYKMRQFFLQNTTVIANFDDLITKCDSYYKMRRLLQIATEDGANS